MRRAIGIAVGLALATAAATAALGEQLAKARVEQAAALPLNKATSARRFLDGASGPLGADAALELARDAYANAPVTGEAVVALSDAAYAAGDDERGRAMLAAAGGLGWHGELVQRVGYIRALERRDYREAALRAEALLRRGRAREQLAADFATAGDNPQFRTAIVDALSTPAPWAEGLLAEQGAQIPLPMLTAILERRVAAGAPAPRRVVAPLVSALVIEGRTLEAARLVRTMDGWDANGLLPGWPDADAEALPTPFEWRVFEGYALLPSPDGTGLRLSRLDLPGARPAAIALALEPGRYRLSFPGADDAGLAAWRYGLGCNGSAARPATALARQQAIDVPAGCTAQILTLGAGREAVRGGGLPAPVLERR